MNDTTKQRILAAADKLIDATAKAVLTDLRERVKGLDRCDHEYGDGAGPDPDGDWLLQREVLALIDQMLAE